MENSSIKIFGAKENNLKGFDLELPYGKLIVISGVSGAGKSSLAFSTLYAEGYRRYVETFSPYARQFLEKFPRPIVKEIKGILPAIGIYGTNSVRTSRSTVGTVSEILDFLKIFWAKVSTIHCSKCKREIKKNTPFSIAKEVLQSFYNKPVIISFSLRLPSLSEWNFAKEFILKNGFLRIFYKGSLRKIEEIEKINEKEIKIVYQRILANKENFKTIVDSLEGVLKWGKGELLIITETGDMKFFSEKLQCPNCKITFKEPVSDFFSFNSPVGACEHCRGFGKVLQIDMDKVILDKNLTIENGAIKPFQTDTYSECKQDLIEYCKRKKIPIDIPFRELSLEQKRKIIEGDNDFYGVEGFFKYLERKSYKMHIRILLSKYRSYFTCPSCNGKRLKNESMIYKIKEKTISEFWTMPLSKARDFILKFREGENFNKAEEKLYNEILKRLNYLCDVGLSYLTLDRESRTLSGGEMERLSLARALGSPLINTLYVLDEPTVGLHSEDISKLIVILKKLAKSGNTVIVVEHDPGIIKSADIIVDLGPQGGEGGGRILYCGDLNGFLNSPQSITARYLSGNGKLLQKSEKKFSSNFIEIKKAHLHNLKNIDVRLPTNSLVVITGVSGSGKSTLLIDVLYESLKNNKNIGCEEIIGRKFFDEVILIDQSPIGTTSRSNPATYTGVFEFIRKEFAKSEDAKLMDFSAGDFSFNSGAERCDECEGAGFHKVEMQFLPDIFLECQKCKGKRYKDEILSIKIKGKNIFDILNSTFEEVYFLFKENETIAQKLKILIDLGLGYIKLGQGANTLSAGEAQRLKLASALQMAKEGKKNLFIMDEPTTGLHPDEISKFLNVVQETLERGHSFFIIEHNLQVISNAHYILDIGPFGGEEGGSVVFSGWFEDFLECKNSLTLNALKRIIKGEEKKEICETLTSYEDKLLKNGNIQVFGAREHNLKSIDVEIPQNKFITITGVSGSGKSTLAFDILYAEGQRRFIETLSVYSRQFIKQLPQPDIDGIENIPPSIAIEQRTSRGGGFSTVATLTGIYYYLRLLFAKLGVQFCTDCKTEVKSYTCDEIVQKIEKKYLKKEIKVISPLVHERKGHYKNLFTSLIKKGFKEVFVDGEILKLKAGLQLSRYKIHNIDVIVDKVKVDGLNEFLKEIIEKALNLGKGVIKIGSITGETEIYNTKRVCLQCGKGYEPPDPRDFTYISPVGRCEHCKGWGYENFFEDENLIEENGSELKVCSLCNGKRLNKKILSILFEGLSIAEVCDMSAGEAIKWFEGIYKKAKEDKIEEEILKEIIIKCKFLNELGLSYLQLSRRGNTLSTGEARRVSLSSHLGKNLSGVLYVLDEPTIGLHPRDGKLLIDKLKQLRDEGNTVIVVEHDENVIRNSDLLIDLGPGSGKYGGEVIAISNLEDIMKNKNSITGRFLNEKSLVFQSRCREIDKKTGFLKIKGARANNLKNIDVEIPLQSFVCITGVSGAGKSTLIYEVLYKGLKDAIDGNIKKGKNFDSIEGYENLRRVLIVDQSPIGRTPRSIPATYIGFFDVIRDFYASMKESRKRGYTKSRFSFNLKGGRCEVCEGQGRIKIEMALLPDVYVVCESCMGKRYNKQTLEIEYNGKNISQVLEMSVDSAEEFFKNIPQINYPIKIMKELGLGYLALGQPSPTLSGGEAQRIKLCEELSKHSIGKTLYILDEPTTGLHRADVEKLLFALQNLIERGDSVIVIEHNLDIIRASDYIIDLGPEGGDGGGEVIFCGPPSLITKCEKSWTGKFFKN